MLRHTWNKAQHLLFEAPTCTTLEWRFIASSLWHHKTNNNKASSVIFISSRGAAIQYNNVISIQLIPAWSRSVISSSNMTSSKKPLCALMRCCDVPPREWLIPKITVTCIASKSCCARSLWHFLSAVKEINLELNCQRMPYPPDLTEDQRIMSRDDDLLLI